ncbi:MAG: prohibitin family protein [Actinomycetaceae bacterium]|nr:prohibitin family protein [Actinomycetaceae bacterium]
MSTSFGVASVYEKRTKRLFMAIWIALAALIVVSGFLFVVQSGTRSLVFSAGKLVAVAGEGLHFKIPLYQRVKNVPITTLKTEEEAEAASSDLQVVMAAVSINYHYDQEKLAEIYMQTHFDVDARIIKPRIQETLKAVSAKHTAEDLIVNRATAKQEIDALLKSSLLRYNIIVEDVQLTNFQFSPEFNRAIEAKQTEAQNTLKAKNVLERTRIESEQRIVQAKAEAEAIRIQAEAIRSQGGSEYVQLKWIEKWNGTPPHVLSSQGASNFMLNLDKK